MQIILNREGIFVISVICYSFFKNCDRIVGYLFFFSLTSLAKMFAEGNFPVIPCHIASENNVIFTITNYFPSKFREMKNI
jgi:hypothetical protein